MTRSSIHTLSDLKFWLRQALRPIEPNVHVLEQIYKHFEDLGYRVEYLKGGRKYIKIRT